MASDENEEDLIEVQPLEMLYADTLGSYSPESTSSPPIDATEAESPVQEQQQTQQREQGVAGQKEDHQTDSSDQEQQKQQEPQQQQQPEAMTDTQREIERVYVENQPEKLKDVKTLIEKYGEADLLRMVRLISHLRWASLCLSAAWRSDLEPHRPGGASMAT